MFTALGPLGIVACLLMGVASGWIIWWIISAKSMAPVWRSDRGVPSGAIPDGKGAI